MFGLGTTLITRYAPAINGATGMFLLGMAIFIVGSLILVNRPRWAWKIIPGLERYIIGTAMTFAGMWVAFGGWQV